MKNLLLLIMLGLSSTLFSQTDDKVEYVEYVQLKVVYGKNTAGIKYKLFLDIGLSGSHSLSGYVTNLDDKVIIKREGEQLVFSSDIDLLNYLATIGWRIIQTERILFLGEEQYCYLLQRTYYK